MFKSLRWRLTLWFVTLTTLVYVLSAVGGIWFFRQGLNNVINDELQALVSEIEPAIHLDGDAPSLKDWARTSLQAPFRYLPTIQLYNSKKELVEKYGPKGIENLFEDAELSRTEGEHLYGNHYVHIYSTPLTADNKLIGYLQIELNLHNRDRSVNTFASTMTWVAPFLLVGLAISGYFFASKAAQPIERSFEVLRQFMADAGHELSTPISIIQANAEQMETEIERPPDGVDRLAVICRSNERLGNLVQDLMLLSKMESPQIEPRRALVDFEKLVAGVLEEFDAPFMAQNIKLTTGKMQPALIWGDTDALKRLVTNLLQNSLRYTEAGGTVTVNLETANKVAKLVVSDTGIGIPPDCVDKIFDRFYRVDKSRSRAQGGSGLGLSIVKAIVDSHKGRIELASTVGHGTTVTVTLPLRAGRV
jgi:signal transduction histidine kinase